jgi:hypothetical protein
MHSTKADADELDVASEMDSEISMDSEDDEIVVPKSTKKVAGKACTPKVVKPPVLAKAVTKNQAVCRIFNRVSAHH